MAKMQARVVWLCAVAVALCTVLLAATAASDAHAQVSGVSISRVDGQIAPGVVRAGDTVVFYMQYNNAFDARYTAISTGFQIYSRQSLSSGSVGSGTATWVASPPINRPFNWSFSNYGTSTGPKVDTSGAFRKRDFSAFFRLSCFGCDGRGADTVVFAAAIGDWNQSGLPPHTSELGFTIWIVTTPGDTGKVICIDSITNYPPSGVWHWYPLCPDPGDLRCTEAVFPNWSGPYCYMLIPYSCCYKRTGNIDCSANGVIDITDLTFLIDHLYLNHQALCCPEAADCDGTPGVDIGDLTALIDRLYISFASLAPCPQ